jgi:hypothetical protein
VPFRHDFLEDVRIILVTVTGTVTRASWEKQLRASLKEAAKHSCYRFLVDFSKAVMRVGFVDLYDRPRLYEESGMPKTARIAIVLPPEAEDRDFIETVTGNRGFTVKVFSELEPGRKWLAPSREPPTR